MDKSDFVALLHLIVVGHNKETDGKGQTKGNNSDKCIMMTMMLITFTKNEEK